MLDLTHKVVLVTGGSSMIGSAIIEALQEEPNVKILAPTHIECSLIDSDNLHHYIMERKVVVDAIIHAAGWNGGIKWNKQYPAEIFYKTSMMALNVLNTATWLKVPKVVSLISSCALPDDGSGKPLNAEDLWKGLPNDSVECHGLSKRMLHAYSKQIKKEYGHNYVSAIVTNSYGPKDSFHLDKTKVVAAIIRKVVEAHEKNSPDIVCWGTGAPKREFMYCKDVGRAIVQVLKGYDDPYTPINVGSREEVSIFELTEVIKNIVGYRGEVLWDTTKPDGQMRKLLNSDPFWSKFPIQLTSLEDGIKSTIEWYRKNKQYADNKC